MKRQGVPTVLYLQSRFFSATQALWRHLAEVESRVVRQETSQLTIDRPVYIAGLARSGTTIVTEMLAQHTELTCHRYSDFPNLWTPYWRNYLLQRARRTTPEKQERAHQDRITINNDSPEAVEEVLWMHFFDHRHDADVNQVLDGRLLNPEFDRFYQQHILKLLAVRRDGGDTPQRYLAKGNYNISRIRYLLSLYPDARFLIPVRDPAQHIASLMRQQALFTRASQADKRVPLQLAMTGHFEFGPQRVPINFGDNDATQAVTDDWKNGHEVQGWARYWAQTYQHVREQMDSCDQVRNACLLFRYEDLCHHSEAVIDAMLAHCELPEKCFEATRDHYVEKLTIPDYYAPNLDEDALAQIAHYCDPVNAKLSRFCQSP